MDKMYLRKKYLIHRQQLSLKTVSSLSVKIIDKLLNTQLYKEAHSLFTYVSVKNEVDTLYLITRALNDQKKVVVPKTYKEGIMRFYEIQSLEDLKTSHFGLLEPIHTDNEVTPDETTLILVPGVVFDYSCNRIGYGAGYYDQYLKSYPWAKTIGLAYESQVIESIPYNEYDIPLNYVLTEHHQYFI